jgi:hypothetical protein
MKPLKANELPDNERYEYLINHAAKHKEVWLLHAVDGLYAMFEDQTGQQYIPVWPEKEYASSYAIDDWDGYSSDRMGLGEFLDWLKELKNDMIFIGVFPDSNFQAIPVDPLVLKQQLEQAAKGN